MILALCIEPEWLRSFRTNWMASGAPGFFESSASRVTPEIRRLSPDLAAEMVHEPAAGARQEGLSSALVIAVIERFTLLRSIGASLRELARANGVDHRVRRAIALMRKNPSATLNVETLAFEAGLSRAHFFRLFETSTGVTPHVFLRARDLRRHQRMPEFQCAGPFHALLPGQMLGGSERIPSGREAWRRTRLAIPLLAEEIRRRS